MHYFLRTHKRISLSTQAMCTEVCYRKDFHQVPSLHIRLNETFVHTYGKNEFDICIENQSCQE